MIKRIIVVLICMASIFIITACGNDNNDNSLDSQKEEISEIASDIIPNNNVNLSLEDFKLKLLEANAIELKDINNETLGVINDKNNITQFINRISEYDIKDNYIEKQLQNVVGPMNIYFNDGAIYGLMKEEYIYLDGYYFMMDRSERNYIVSLFGRNIHEISGSQ